MIIYFYYIGCVIFGMRRKTKKKAKERGFPGLEDMMVWRDFKPPHILEAI